MKKFVAGVLFGIGIAIAMSAQAETLSLIGRVVQGEIGVRVDGKELSTPAIVIDGTSYLPVRALAQAFGAEVNFAGKIVDIVTPAPKEVESEQGTDGEETAPKADPAPQEEAVREEHSVGTDTEKTLSQVERELRGYRSYRVAVTANLRNAKTDEARAQFQAELDEIDRKIAELESEKAALEAKKAVHQ